MNRNETDLLISILNLIIEASDYSIDEQVFGYDPKTLEISCSDYTLEEGLEQYFNELKELIKGY